MNLVVDYLYMQKVGLQVLKITPLPCSTSMMDKINELRKDLGLNNQTKMVVMLSFSTDDMNRYVAMYPKVWFIDCTAGMLFKILCENFYDTNS